MVRLLYKQKLICPQLLCVKQTEFKKFEAQQTSEQRVSLSSIPSLLGFKYFLVLFSIFIKYKLIKNIYI